MEKTITLKYEDYEELCDSQRFLDLLEAYGVDNWDGYDMARQEFNEAKDHL